MPTAATQFLNALAEAGVSYIFANLGTDHPPILEALAAARAEGRCVPRLITCPHEMVALSAAHGYAQATGRAQAVLVHVDCGTQSLAGAVHNAAKGRVPAFIFAGLSPFTQEGELRGSRNEWVHWVQDVQDQRGIVRGYVKYENEIRTGRNIQQMVRRAMQIAYSDPKGPVYLTASREVLEEEVPAIAPLDGAFWQPVAPGAIDPEAARQIAEDLMGARRPLAISTYLGRNPEAVAELVKLCRALGVGVWTSIPTYLDFPADDPLYLGNQVNAPEPNAALAEDPDGQQAARGSEDLSHRCRSAEGADAAVVFPDSAFVSSGCGHGAEADQCRGCGGAGDGEDRCRAGGRAARALCGNPWGADEGT
jgi:acetolactate synthase I/II/III large subunit